MTGGQEAPPASVEAALGSLDALTAGLASGAWSPLDVVEAVLGRRGRGQRAAWIDQVPAPRLREAARRLEREGPAGRRLWGVPFAVKGNIDVAGLPTTAGCPTYAAGPAARHAAVVARLVAAGALPVGTTNLDQFATGLVGTRSPYGACHAVGHPGWVSGGSSSGSAVVVAEGEVPFALATDTAGSGRVPAALNGIAALKPTRGRIATTGVVPACRSLDCVGVFAASPAEAATVVALAAGPDPEDPWSRGASAPIRRVGADRLPRIGVPAPEHLDLGGDPAAAGAHAAALARARARGWELVEVDLGPFLAAGELLYGGALVAERYAAVGEFVRSRPAGLDPVVAGIIVRAGQLPAWRAYADADRIRALAATTGATWHAVDALLLPVVPTTVTHAAVAADPVAANARLGTYTTFANLLDLCVAVAPVGLRADGHPWGVQIVGPAWADDRVASLAQDLTEPTAFGHLDRWTSPTGGPGGRGSRRSPPTCVEPAPPVDPPTRRVGRRPTPPTPSRSSASGRTSFTVVGAPAHEPTTATAIGGRAGEPASAGPSGGSASTSPAGPAPAPAASGAGQAGTPSATSPVVPPGLVPLVVAGAHLRGEAREHEVVDHGGHWCATTRTAHRYALRLVADEPPRPGLVRTAGAGAAVEVDVWALPPAGWAAFVAAGVPGVAVGPIEMADGSVLPGFVAAADEATGRPDLTPFGGWRAWQAAGAPR